MSIAKLSEGFPMTRQAITKHLRMMEGAGLVNSSQKGRESVWQLAPKRLDDARRRLGDISSEWDRALTRLKHFVER